MEKLARKKPIRKIEYTAKDLQSGQMILCYSFGATRLGKILFLTNKKDDPIPWVRVHLYCNDAKERGNFKQYWLDENKNDTILKKPGVAYTEFWDDIYPKNVIYILKYALKEGRMDPRDENYIKTTWGGQISILLTTPR